MPDLNETLTQPELDEIITAIKSMFNFKDADNIIEKA